MRVARRPGRHAARPPAILACDGVATSAASLEIPVHIAANRDGRYLDYNVQLGSLNEFDSVCAAAPGVKLIWALEDASRYQIVDLQFADPEGPVAVPGWVIAGDHATADVVFGDQPASLKYTLVVRDQRTGAVIYHDPRVTNED